MNLEQRFREKMVASKVQIQSEITKTEEMSRLLQNEIGAADGIFDGMRILLQSRKSIFPTKPNQAIQ